MTDFLTNREMRTVIKGSRLNWRTVTSGVQQGSVLAHILFTVYVNDVTEGVESYMNLFTHDAKIMRKVTNEEDCNALNQDLIKINEGLMRWNMEFNAKKCSVMRFGKSVKRSVGNYYLGNEEISIRSEEKDLGVIITDNLSFGKHINKIIGETYHLLRNIKIVFSYID